MKRLPSKVNRRDVLKITAVMGGLAAAGGLIDWLSPPEIVKVVESRYLMGTLINLALIADRRDDAEAALRATFHRMETLIRIFDPRQADGPLARLNQNGKLDDPPSELTALLRQALAYGEQTNGAFDITVKPVVDAYRTGKLDITEELQRVDYRQVRVSDVQISCGIPGMQVTLDGIAKGRVVDEGVSVLKKSGFEQVLVEAGGDLFAQGLNQDQHFWKVAVMHPRANAEQRWLTTLAVSNRAVATSGDYLNSFSSDYGLHHIIDPRLGVSATELCSATVVALDTAQADAFGTALMVMGVEKGLTFVEQQENVECLLVNKTLSCYRSSGFPTI